MQDSPSCEELLVAVADFLETDIMPMHQDRTAFQVRIAASVCRILARENRLEPGFLEEEHATLTRLLGQSPLRSNAKNIGSEVRELASDLVEALSKGSLRADSAGVFEAVEALVRHKLLVVNPTYLGSDIENEVRT